MRGLDAVHAPRPPGDYVRWDTLSSGAASASIERRCVLRCKVSVRGHRPVHQPHLARGSAALLVPGDGGSGAFHRIRSSQSNCLGSKFEGRPPRVGAKSTEGHLARVCRHLDDHSERWMSCQRLALPRGSNSARVVGPTHCATIADALVPPCSRAALVAAHVPTARLRGCNPLP